MRIIEDDRFQAIVEDLRLMFLKSAVPVDVGEWHSQPVNNPMLVTRELQDVILVYRVDRTIEGLQADVRPNLPWAEDHFQERVSGRPLNPPPSNEWWPFAQAGNASHKASEGYFSHTYPERFWPKYASDTARIFAADEEDWHGYMEDFAHNNRGIRFDFGDLNDVVTMLFDNPETRQAYLPVWFPEDTGTTHGERVPCTLGYHFMIRDGRLSCRYYIRSCDYVRHFKDDVYMAARLMQWICDKIPNIRPGQLLMYISSFHVFEGDVPKLKGA